MSTDPNQKVEITVHWLEKSRSQRILWLLEELKLNYTFKSYKRQGGLAPPELKEVHPLGKSPVIGVKTENAEKPLILAESAVIVEYLTDHFGKWLEPKKYPEGKEGQVGAETQEWLRYRYFMHYTEGSLMPFLVLALIVRNIREAPVWFFIKPITNGIASRVESGYLFPNFKTHFKFLEDQLASSPNGGDYLCGKEITGADILLSFPLEAATTRAGLTKEQYPHLFAYVDKIQKREAYQKAIKRVEEETGETYSTL